MSKVLHVCRNAWQPLPKASRHLARVGALGFGLRFGFWFGFGFGLGLGLGLGFAAHQRI